MIAALVASVALYAPAAQTAQDDLDALRLLASQVALGQVCEAIERTTVNFPVLVAHAEAIVDRTSASGTEMSALNDVQEQGYAQMMAYIEREYAEGREGANFPKLLEECDTLMREQPRFFGPFIAS